jgi:hypothetical protein
MSDDKSMSDHLKHEDDSDNEDNPHAPGRVDAQERSRCIVLFFRHLIGLHFKRLGHVLAKSNRDEDSIPVSCKLIVGESVCEC